jgi:tetratricopeptide (TPR) repeat protein
MIDEANTFIQRGMALFPDNLALKDEYCYVLEGEERYEEAIRFYNELIDNDPYSYDYWFNLGRMYSFTNAFSEAIEAFDFALTCSDGSENEMDNELKVLRAYCYFMNENYEKAVNAYLEILPVEDETANDRIKSLIAECHSKLEDFEASYRILTEIINKDSSDAYVYLNYIRCCMETDRGQEASKMLHKAAGLFPDNVRILTLLALSYLEGGKDDLAIAVTEQIIRCMEEAEFKSIEESDDAGSSDTFLNEILQSSLQAVSQKPIPINELAKEYLSNRKYRN